jgi:hypothetical protein
VQANSEVAAGLIKIAGTIRLATDKQFYGTYELKICQNKKYAAHNRKEFRS